MGEIYLDNFERLSITERPGGRDGDGTRHQEARADKEYRPGRAVTLPHPWAAPACDNDNQRESLLSGAS